MIKADSKAMSSIASILILLIVIISLWILSTNSGLTFTSIGINLSDIDIIRDSLKALLQMQATVFAIVIGFSIAAVQLAASAYSLRLFGSFTRNPWVWIITTMYLCSIALNFWLLTILVPPRTQPETQTQSATGYGGYVTFSYLLGFLVLFMLLPYLHSMARILSPEGIILKLGKNIANALDSTEDPFQPIDDIICASLTKYDYATARTGLQEMKNQTVGLIDSEKIRDLYDPQVSHDSKRYRRANTLHSEISSRIRCYCEHLERLGMLFLRRKEERLALQAIVDLSELEYALTKKRHSMLSVVDALKAIGCEATEKRVKMVAQKTIYVLEKFGEASIERYKAPTLYPIDKSQFGVELSRIAQSIAVVGRKFIALWPSDWTRFQVAMILGKISAFCAENKCEMVTEVTTYLFETHIEALSEVAKISEYIPNEEADVTTTLTNIGRISHRNEFREGIRIAALGLWTIGLWASERNLTITKELCVQGLVELAILDREMVNSSGQMMIEFDRDIESKKGFTEFLRTYRSELAKKT